jgi:hypothetical protein
MEQFWNLPTKATQIDCSMFSPAAKKFETAKCWNLPTKATQID